MLNIDFNETLWNDEADLPYLSHLISECKSKNSSGRISVASKGAKIGSVLRDKMRKA